MVTKELCIEIERLGKGLDLRQIGDRLGFSKYKIWGMIRKYDIPYEKKIPKPYARRRLTREIFKKRIKRQYAKADVWLRQDCGKLLLVMERGRLKDSPEAIKWWKEKIDKAWGRRDRFPS